MQARSSFYWLDVTLTSLPFHADLSLTSSPRWIAFLTGWKEYNLIASPLTETPVNVLH